MTWHARLQLRYEHVDARTVLRFEHDGPLRVLQSLYPEGDAICHNVLVHPPGGLVGGDAVDVQARVGGGAHALITTPGAARFYRSDGDLAIQRVHLALAPGSRLEWLPAETIAYDGCLGRNRLELELGAGAELIGWDVLALGLPQSGKPYAHGQLLQQIVWPGVWQDSGRIDATDRRLLDSPLGLGGHRCLATLFLARGGGLPRDRQEQALESARAVIDTAIGRDGLTAGATCIGGSIIVVRVVAPLVEPAMALVRQIRAVWRQVAWQLPPTVPRIWAT